METLTILIWLGLAAGGVALANYKGRNPILWGILGLVGGVIALLILAALPNLQKAAAAEEERRLENARHAETIAALAGRRPAATERRFTPPTNS